MMIEIAGTACEEGNYGLLCQYPLCLQRHSTPKVWVSLLLLHDSAFEVRMLVDEESEQACMVDKTETDHCFSSSAFTCVPCFHISRP